MNDLVSELKKAQKEFERLGPVYYGNTIDGIRFAIKYAEWK